MLLADRFRIGFAGVWFMLNGFALGFWHECAGSGIQHSSGKENTT